MIMNTKTLYYSYNKVFLSECYDKQFSVRHPIKNDNIIEYSLVEISVIENINIPKNYIL